MASIMCQNVDILMQNSKEKEESREREDRKTLTNQKFDEIPRRCGKKKH